MTASIGPELVNAGVVDQDVQPAIVLDGGVDDALGLGSLGNVPTDGDSLAARGGDGIDDRFRAGLARRVIDHHGRAFRGQ